MKNYIIYFLSLINIALLTAQDVPSPGKPDNRRIYYTGAIIHIGDGKVIENGVLGTENGKIVLVADATLVKLSPADTTIVLNNHHIYPGLISANSLLGLKEIEAVRATNDTYEVGDINPNVRALIAYNTDSRVIPTVRSNGVLIAQIRPEGGVIQGSSSVVQLDAWNWEDAAVKTDDGIYLNWPSLITRAGWWAEPEEDKKNEKYNDSVQELKDYLLQAKSYCNIKSPNPLNLKFEAFRSVFAKQKRVYVEANQQKQIIDAIQLAKSLDIDIAIVGARDSWMILDIIKENNIPVVLQKTHTLPYMEDDDVNMFYKLPSVLQEKGIMYCITAENSSGEQRNLPFTAGKAVAFGLTKEQALSAITANPAKILGINDRLGTIEVGKDATFIISTGDILDITTNDVVDAYVSGRKLNLGNRHKDLYKKFADKYGIPVVRP